MTSTPSTTTPSGTVTLNVNGESTQVAAVLHDTLLTVLRERMQLTAAKRGCNQGVCGACTISIDDTPMRACLSLAHNCEQAQVHTLEGLQDCPHMQALQAAFARAGAFQCGFCTPGMLVSARALLLRNPDPDAQAIRSALSGNLCRCTGYVKIIDAVRTAASALRLEGAAS